MTTPYRIVEEYIFHSKSTPQIVRGRILEQVVSEERQKSIDDNHLANEIVSWDVNFYYGPQSPSNYHSSSIDVARQQLFKYVADFDNGVPDFNPEY